MESHINLKDIESLLTLNLKININYDSNPIKPYLPVLSKRLNADYCYV